MLPSNNSMKNIQRKIRAKRQYEESNIRTGLNQEENTNDQTYDQTNNQSNGSLTQKYYISRHLRSCNNVVDDKHPMFGVLKKQGEPSLSLWGTLTGLGLNRNILGEFNNKVYVSCLVRTWMTAILEYFPSCENNELTLIVAPFIKEKHIVNFDYGNLPILLNKQIEKLIQFYDFLLLIKQSLSQETKNTSLYEKIIGNLNKILSSNAKINILFPYDNKSIQLIYKNNKLQTEEIVDSNYNPYQKSSNVSDIRIYKGGKIFKGGQLFKGGNSINENKQYINDVFNRIVPYDSRIKIDDITLDGSINIDTEKTNNISKVYTDYFGKTGIFLFVSWVQNEMKDYHKDIYVVAHSNIMQATLIEICKLVTNNPKIVKKTLKLCNQQLKIIQKQNIWELILDITSYKTTEYNLKTLNSIVIREGENPPNKNAKNIIKLKKEVSCLGKELVFDNEEELLSSPTKNDDIVMLPNANIIQQYNSYVTQNPKLLPRTEVFEKMDKIYLEIKKDSNEEKQTFKENSIVELFNMPANVIRKLDNLIDVSNFSIVLQNNKKTNLYKFLTMILYFNKGSVFQTGSTDISQIKNQLGLDLHRAGTININDIIVPREELLKFSENNEYDKETDYFNNFVMNEMDKEKIKITLNAVNLIDISCIQQTIQFVSDMVTYKLTKKHIFQRGGKKSLNIILKPNDQHIEFNSISELMDISDLDNEPKIWGTISFVLKMYITNLTYTLTITTNRYDEKDNTNKLTKLGKGAVNLTKEAVNYTKDIGTDALNFAKNNPGEVAAGVGVASVLSAGIGTVLALGLLGGKKKRTLKHINKRRKSLKKHLKRHSKLKQTNKLTNRRRRTRRCKN